MALCEKKQKTDVFIYFFESPLKSQMVFKEPAG